LNGNVSTPKNVFIRCNTVYVCRSVAAQSEGKFKGGEFNDLLLCSYKPQQLTRSGVSVVVVGPSVGGLGPPVVVVGGLGASVVGPSVGGGLVGASVGEGGSGPPVVDGGLVGGPVVGSGGGAIVVDVSSSSSQ
jgi:hypothetical protein